MNRRPHPLRPEIIAAGDIHVKQDGDLWVGGWTWYQADPDPGPAADLAGAGLLQGYSIRELHEFAHGADCWCPVLGFRILSDGAVTLAYDEIPGCTPGG